jgi:tetratricopeptide (TPR) repeat protein
MKKLHSLGAVCLCMTIGAPFAASGATYWVYSYKGMDVTSSGGAENAKNIAHDLSRLDTAITAVLRIKSSDWRPPTRVYVMPESVFSMVRGKKDDSLSLYIPGRLGNVIEINASNTRADEMYGAFFGYTGSVLLNAYSFRYPPWFVRGLSETFGASVISSGKVSIGEASPARVRPLLSEKLIPMRELLALHFDDPQLRSPNYFALYNAESWLLVHLIVLEGKYHSNFFNYFLLLDQGQEEAKAFAASFDVSYEDLDKMLNAVVRAGKIQISKVAIADEPDPGLATRLTDAEAAGRLAAVAATHGANSDQALQMANEAIALGPKNPDALFALAHVQFQRADYTAALQATDKLCSLDSPTQKTLANCGRLFSRLAGAVLGKKATLDVEGQALRERSRGYYDKAITMDSEDIGSYEGMADLLADMRNADYSQAFLPSAQGAMSAHSHAGGLARSLAGMCSAMGNNVMALNYAVMWQNAALSEAERDSAATYVSHLKGVADRNNLRDAGGPH